MRRIPCVGAIITDAAGRLLLIKRGTQPEAGRWSLPGGRVEPGESDQQALVREVAEETGLTVAPGPLVGTVERPWRDGASLDIRDYRATVTGGELAAGDDAAEACWAGPAELAKLPLTSGLAETLTRWGVLGQPAPALVAEATRQAGVVWLAVPGRDRPFPAWHVWLAGAAYVVTGPGEQPLPGLASAATVRVVVASKETGGTIAEWTAAVRRVKPGTPEWASAAAGLAARRLNAVLAPGETSPAARWARSAAIFRLSAEDGMLPSA
jgi:8-oxo-dGTP diphosphatase